MGAGDEVRSEGHAWPFLEDRMPLLESGHPDQRYSHHGTNALTGNCSDSHMCIHTVRSKLVYRFNWGGPVVAKY